MKSHLYDLERFMVTSKKGSFLFDKLLHLGTYSWWNTRRIWVNNSLDDENDSF